MPSMSNQKAYGTGRLAKEARAKGAVWIGHWTDPRGSRRRKVLSTDKRVAERALAKIIRDRDLELLGLRDEEGQDRTLDDLRSRYLADLKTRVTPRQLARITGVLDRHIDHFGPIRVRDLRVEAVLGYRQLRQAQDAANRTINLEVGALRSMLKWSLEAGIIGKNPLANIRPLPTGKAHEKAPRRALSRAEIDALINAAERIDARLGARHRAEKSISDGTRGQAYAERERATYVPQAPLWRTLILTGARWGELTACRWSDFDCEQGILRLRAETTKAKKERLLPLLPEIVEAIGSLRGLRPDQAHIFLGPRGKPVRNSYRRALYRFRELLDEAGIEDGPDGKIDIHALRHTFASELGRAGVPLTQAQKLMGHSDPKLTAALYTHLGVEDLRNALARLQRQTAAVRRSNGNESQPA